MISKSDKQFIDKVDRALRKGRTWQSIADEMDIPLSTLYLRIKSLGYKTAKRLVPIHAPQVDDTQVA